MKIKKIITTGAEIQIKKLTDLKYYISGRWRIERRKKYSGAIEGKERRQKAA